MKRNPDQASAGAVPRNARIMDRRCAQVNRIARRFACSVALGVVAWVGIVGCSANSAAERAYEQAQRHIEQNEIEDAVRVLASIVERYPDTQVAAAAREDLTLYEGLSTAVETYPERRVRDSMIRAARAVYTFRSRRGAWPTSLAALAPRDLPEAPSDPWGRPLRYQVKPGGGYVLGCLGSDGQPGGTGEARDWFIEDRSFVARPSVDLP